jgi:lipase maturation factor 1
MWFAALRPNDVPAWFVQFAAKLLEGDPQTIKLLKNNPFPEQPPRQVRAFLYEYRFTTGAERRQTGRWWNRRLVGVYLPPMALAGTEDPCWSSQSPNDLKQITVPSPNRK